MNIPNNLKYTKEHEWALTEGSNIVVGITDHAQSALGDIVFTELPAVGRVLKRGETFGVVESIKAVSDLYSPLSGKVIEINGAIVADPVKLNQDPYGSWLIKIAPSNPSELNELLSPSDYQKLTV